LRGATERDLERDGESLYNLCVMIENNKQTYLRQEYTARVNRVIDYIEVNIDQELSLSDLARVAGFSSFHFHRIFSSMVGETLNSFIQRIRIEKAAGMLVQNPKESVTAIALECGFSGASPFAREFRRAFGMSASEWRASSRLRESKNGKTESKNDQTASKTRQDLALPSQYIVYVNKRSWRVEMQTNNDLIASIEVRDIPEMHVAYIRHIGPYAGNMQMFGQLFGRLAAWAGPRGLLSPEAKFLTLYHDNPGITNDKKLRTDIGVTVPKGTRVDGEIGKAVIPAGKYAVAHFEIKPDQFGAAWNAVDAGWIPESGYQIDDRPCFEVYLNDPKDHPEGKFIFDIYESVKPL
jgi:AraC family transcriptional regulator